VPALIRLYAYSEASWERYGLKMDDPALLAFLRNMISTRTISTMVLVSEGRTREITGALHAITGQRFNEMS